MSFNMNDQEFIDKYGFSINDFTYSCIYEIMKKSYWCCTVSELAYDIASKIHDEIDRDNINESEILYKLTEDTIWKRKVYTHNISIRYEDLYFCFEIGWVGNSLSVKDWDIKTENEILNDKAYYNIDELVNENEIEI